MRRESEFLLYTAPDGAVKVDVLIKDETAWLTQKALAELFGVGVPAIARRGGDKTPSLYQGLKAICPRGHESLRA